MRHQFLQAVVDNIKVHFPDQQLLQLVQFWARPLGLAMKTRPRWPFMETVIKMVRLLQVDTVQAVDQLSISNNRCVNATRQAVAIVFNQMRKRAFFENLNTDLVQNHSLIFIKVYGPKPEDWAILTFNSGCLLNTTYHQVILQRVKEGRSEKCVSHGCSF